MIVQLGQTAMVAAVALLFTLFAFGNITDPDTNWQFVRHVMAMDTIFPDSTLRWRAVTDPGVQKAVYGLIIATESATAILLWLGAARMLATLRGPGFVHAKRTAVAGLMLGFLLYAVAFMAIAGEWFAMWQSQTWNGQASAARFIALIGIVLIVLMLPESRPSDEDPT
jgi:predicted small integral membrane protein